MKHIFSTFLFSSYAVVLYNLLTRKYNFFKVIIAEKIIGINAKKLFLKPFLILYELVFSFSVIFCISRLDLTYFLPKAWPSSLHSYYTYIIFFVVASLIALVATIFNFYLYFRKKDKYKKYYLIKIKKLKLLPLTSVFYATIAFLVVIVGLTTIELTSDHSDWLKEQDTIEYLISNKKAPVSNNGYPLVKLIGTELDTKAPVKILVIGDSFVAGSGTSNLNYLWWKQLQNELDKRGYNCVVYGVGRGGFSTYDQLGWLTKTTMVKDLNPDIIIIGYVINDTELPGVNQNPKVWLNFSDLTGLPVADILSCFFPSVFQSLKYIISDKAATYAVLNNEKWGYQYKNYLLQLVSDEHLKKFKPLVIEPLGDFVKSIDIPVLLLTTPDIPDKEFYQVRYEPVLPLFEEAGLRVYNSLDDFCLKYSDEKYHDGYYINPVNGHPGTFSNIFYAQFLADKLEADYSSLLGKKGAEVLTFDIEITDWTPGYLSPKKTSSNEMTTEYKIKYPDNNLDENEQRRFLFLPVKKDYVKLNFKHPVDISSVSISGENLQSVTLYVTKINDTLGYDDQTMYKLGKKKGENCLWLDTNALYVTSLCIHAKILNNVSADLSVSITRAKGDVYS